MAYAFGDGFDCYAAPADAIAGYWDSGNSTNWSLATGRFSGSLGLQGTTGNAVNALVLKNSGSNDAVHHISVAVQQSAAITGTSPYHWFTLLDGATAQCSVVFRSDGAILLAAGASNGTVLATYTGALTASNTWYQFEIEVRISNTAGYMIVRKLGNTTADFVSATNLDTSANANDYANRLTVGVTIGTNQTIDDLLWRSDSVANGVAWVGDIRCSTRRPASDAAVTWSRSGTGSLSQSFAGGQTTTLGILNTASYATQYTVSYAGSIASVTIVTGSAAAGNIKAAVWADNAGVPGAVLATANPITVVAAGNNVLTLTTPLTVTPGQKIWVGASIDTNGGFWGSSAAIATGATFSVAYASFPQANPVATIPGRALSSSINYSTPTGNWQLVQEPQQDAAATYVYSSTPGQSDLYGVGAISSTPASTVMVVTRAFCQKSDAGTRTLSVQLKSGGTTVSSTPATALNTVWGWISRVDTVDPATGAAWTAVGVNNAQIGVIVAA